MSLSECILENSIDKRKSDETMWIHKLDIHLCQSFRLLINSNHTGTSIMSGLNWCDYLTYGLQGVNNLTRWYIWAQKLENEFMLLRQDFIWNWGFKDIIRLNAHRILIYDSLSIQIDPEMISSQSQPPTNRIRSGIFTASIIFSTLLGPRWKFLLLYPVLS